MGNQTKARDRQPKVADGRSPLWRAHNGFRAIALVYATVWFCLQQGDYARPNLGLVQIVVMALWTAFSVWRYSSRAGRTNKLVLLDQALVTLLFFGGQIILTDAQMESGAPSVVSLWHATMVIAAAVQWGALGGGLSGAFAAGCNLLLRGYFDSAMALDTVLLICCGLVVGMAADTARKSTERLAKALRAEAATAERERLARSIHDSVLQVLARVRHRGRDLGGEAAELAHLAGEQEIALRSLIATGPSESADSAESGEVDLAARLRSLRSSAVEVSVPATAVELAEQRAEALHSVVQEALENVRKHAGADAHAWVLLEDLGEELVLTVRDNGPGIPEGRLDQANDEGRMGVAQSIRGRVESLGGTVTLETGSEEGTEWEVQVPRGETTGGRSREPRSNGTARSARRGGGKA